MYEKRIEIPCGYEFRNKKKLLKILLSLTEYKGINNQPEGSWWQ